LRNAYQDPDMQLTRYTDYAFRILIHVGVQPDGRLSSIPEIAEAYGISRSHLMKVVHDLGQAEFLHTVRGRNGGLTLGKPPREIGLGAIVRHTEPGMRLVDCSGCVILPACGLPRILAEATRAFLAVLDQYTLQDLLRGDERFLQELLGLEAA
jgi:Rrf2 family nitric oxide-sensitive transcriptional repressor